MKGKTMNKVKLKAAIGIIAAMTAIISCVVIAINSNLFAAGFSSLDGSGSLLVFSANFGEETIPDLPIIFIVGMAFLIIAAIPSPYLMKREEERKLSKGLMKNVRKANRFHTRRRAPQSGFVDTIGYISPLTMR